MSDKKWWLDMQIPVGGHSLAETDFDFWTTLNDFMLEKFPGECDAGTGFGMREYNYPRETREECIFLLARVRKELAKKFGEDLVQISKFEIRQY